MEHQNIGKTPLYGRGFVEVYLDNEKNSPRLQPSSCRIIKKNLPNELKSYLREKNNRFHSSKDHYYFYWIAEINNLNVKDVHRKFKEIKNKLDLDIDKLFSKSYNNLISNLSQ